MSMISRQSLQRILALGLATMLVGACATNYTRITAQMAPRVLPPRLDVHRIAVMDFQGQNGAEVSQELEAELVNHLFNGRHYFTVVDRARTRSLMAEYARGLRGEINPATAARFGRQIGAQAILFGRVTSNRVDTSYQPGRVMRCVAENSSGFCVKYRSVETTCLVKRAKFGVIARLVNVESAQVVYSKERIGTAGSESCSGQGTSNMDLLTAARTRALAQVVPDIAPSNVILKVAFKTDPVVLKGKQKDRFASAVSFAYAGRMDRACEIWRTINNSPSTKKDVSVIYDLAICAEARGKLRESLDLVRTADRLLTGPDKDIDASLGRLQAEINQRQRIGAMR